MNKVLENSGKYPGYTASIQKISHIENIKNMHNLVYASVGLQRVLVSKNFKEGDIVVYIPYDTVVSSKYLNINNLYSISSLNSNFRQYVSILNDASISEETKHQQLRCMRGYFDESGKVSIIKLQGLYSPGFIAGVDTIEAAYPRTKNIEWEKYIGVRFDIIYGEAFCGKYMCATDKPVVTLKEPDTIEKSFDYFRSFPLNPSAFHLYDNEEIISPHAEIDVTVKIHGIPFAIGNIECNKPLNFIDKIKKFLGVHVDTTMYMQLYYVNGLIQNRYENQIPDDRYSVVYELIKHHIPKNMVVFGEICGYIPKTSTYIKDGYDYRCDEGEYKFMPYRIVTINSDGTMKEWTVKQVIDWTTDIIKMMPHDKVKYLMPMTLLFHGEFDDIIKFYVHPEMTFEESIENWRICVYESLKILWGGGIEENEPLCVNKVPREGIVIRMTNDNTSNIYKLESMNYYMHTKM